MPKSLSCLFFHGCRLQQLFPYIYILTKILIFFNKKYKKRNENSFLFLLFCFWSKKCYTSSTLNSGCEFSLMRSTATSLSAWQYFAFFCDILFKFCCIFIIYCFIFVCTKWTNFFTHRL